MKDLEKLYSDYGGKIFAIYAWQILLKCILGIHSNPLDAIETMKLGYNRVEGLCIIS